MIRLAATAAALVLTVGCAGGGLHQSRVSASKAGRPAVAGLRRELHYFSVGERECRAQLRHQHGADVLVLVRTYPSGYATQVEAGCQAAIPAGIRPSRYFRLGSRICARAGVHAMEAISRHYDTLPPVQRTAVLQGCWTEMNSAGGG